MGKVVESITPDLQSFIAEQSVFFVATAPLARHGHVNLSPKGLDTFAVLGERRVAYLDLTGSGNETSAHVGENGRITVMFCAFSGPPKIVRLYGRGRAVLPDEALWDELAPRFPELPGVRQIIVIDVDRVQTSCGFGVPLLDEGTDREALVRWARSKGEDDLEIYRAEKNARSIDGLPARLRT